MAKTLLGVQVGRGSVLAISPVVGLCSILG